MKPALKQIALVAATPLLMTWACVEETSSGRFDDDASATSTSSGGGSAGSGTVGGMGGASTSTNIGAGPTTSTGGSGGDCANDMHEPNATEATAVFLGTIEDCDSQTLRVDATLVGNDVDWFYYNGTDELGCNVDPTRTVSADGQIMVCKYAECSGSNVEVTCPNNDPVVMSPEGRPGCCTTQLTLSHSPNCLGTTNDSSTIYIRMTKPSGFQCVNYSLDIHY